MKIKFTFLSLFLGLMLGFSGVDAQVVINEFMASNTSTLADNFGEFDDWVELRNNGAAAVNVAGYYLSDNTSTPTAWQIPSTNSTVTTIAAGGYLLIWFDAQPAQGLLHATPKLTSTGESVLLMAANGTTVLDVFTFGAQTANVSMGRFPNGTGTFSAMTTPTPNAANIYTAPAAATPVASVAAGFYVATQSVTLSSTTPSATIRYTLDGSLPTTSSTLYTGPISISTTKSLRAVAYATNFSGSAPMTNTYFINASHTFPVVSLSTNPAYMFDATIGVYPNYLNPAIEQPIHLEFFNSTVMQFEADAITKCQGSSAQAQKSLSLKASQTPAFNFAFFPDMTYTSYGSIVLRNGGQDVNLTMFRDEFLSGLMRNFTDVAPLMKNPDLDMQGYRPSVVYLNGVYWGIHNLRERMNESFVETHYGLGASQIDLLEDSIEVNEGDVTAWNSFVSFYANNNFATVANYDSLKKLMDVGNWIDYNAFNIYIDNADWPGNNNRHWREKTATGEWRWLCFDQDLSWGLSVTGQAWNSGNATANSLSRALAVGGSALPNPNWSTLLLRKCLESPQFKLDFVNRMADLMNIAFDSVRVNNHLENFQALYAPEIAAHMTKWNSSVTTDWVPNINKLKTFSNNRAANVRQHVVDEFAEVTGTAAVTLQASPALGGTIHFSTLTQASANLPWTGTYFTGVNIPFKAYANKGYVFSSWSDAALGTSANALVNLTAAKTITANFSLGSVVTTPIVINEINYNSLTGTSGTEWIELANPNNAAVNISGWSLEDESGNFYGLPANTTIPALGFLVITADTVAFRAIYTNPAIALRGSFGGGITPFDLNNAGERIRLSNANNVMIDTVRYDDVAPWPISPDGTGPTLQLNATNLDNTIATNWVGQAATPGFGNFAQAQSITLGSILDKPSTAAPFTVAATATSGLTVTLTILSGPATVSGNTITLTGAAGTVVVQASQAGNPSYLPAPNVTTSFNVTSAGINIATSSTQPSCSLSNGAITATPTNGVTPYNYLWSNGQTTSTISSLAAGTYTVTVTGNNAATATKSATLTMASTAPTAAVSPNTGVLSCANPSIIVTASGSAGITFNWGNGITTAARTITVAGTYTVTVANTAGCTATASTAITSLNDGAPYYADTDGDGFGAGVVTLLCAPTAGYVPNNCDCNNNVATANPNGTEVANNGIDENCNGIIDDACVNIDSAASKVIHVSPTSVIIWFPNMNGANTYNVQYRTIGAAVWSATVTSSTPGISITGLTAATNYEYKIRTKCGATFTAYSNGRPFTTKAATGVCDKPIIGGGTPISTLSAKLYWNFSYSATKYSIRYRRTDSTTWIAKTISPVSGVLTPSTTLSGLSPGGAYIFQVRSYCPPATWTAYSSTTTFVMPNTPLVCPMNILGNPIGENFMIQNTPPNTVRLYPNPTNDLLTIEVNTDQTIACSVIDLTGRRLLNYANISSGQTIDVSQISTGIYLLRIEMADGQVVTQRFVKQ